MKNKGFTLIDLMTVIAITVILSTVLTFRYSTLIKTTKDSTALSAISAYRMASRLYTLENENINDFQDILNKDQLKINTNGARALYSSYEDTMYKGLYYSGIANGNLGFLEVGTNSSGKIVKKGSSEGTPLIAVGINLATGDVVVIQDSFNGKDTKSVEWFRY